jgi:hypothetical protein
MITLTREEAQSVLDALEGSIDAQEWEIDDHITKYGEWYRPKRVEYMKQQLANTNSTIETLRARLSAPEPTLVLWNVKSNRLASPSDDRAQVFAIRKLEWRGLTDEEVSEIERTSMTRAQAICAIEAKLREKNG